MKNSTLLKLIILLIILISLWFGQNWWSQNQSQQYTSWGNLEINDVEPERVDKISISNQNQTLEISRNTDNWTVDGTAADTNLIDPLLKIIAEPRAELISQNTDRHQALGVDEQSAIKISFWQGDTEKLTLLISQNNSSIVRKKDMQNVYRVTQPLSINTNPSNWQISPIPTTEPSEATPSTEITD